MEHNKTVLGNKRKDYLNWDEFFMGIAKLAAGRSKDPNTQVGACIVSEDNRILSIGYNVPLIILVMTYFHGVVKEMM